MKTLQDICDAAFDKVSEEYYEALDSYSSVIDYIKEYAENAWTVDEHPTSFLLTDLEAKVIADKAIRDGKIVIIGHSCESALDTIIK